MSLYYPALHSRFILGKSTPFPSLGSFHTRQLFMSGAVTVWAARLGTFLFQRISNEGKDGRFDEIKQSPPKFFGAWMAQATWVSLTALPVYIVNSIPKASQPALGLVDIAGFALWTGAFLFEVSAPSASTEALGTDPTRHTGSRTGKSRHGATPRRTRSTKRSSSPPASGPRAAIPTVRASRAYLDCADRVGLQTPAKSRSGRRRASSPSTLCLKQARTRVSTSVDSAPAIRLTWKPGWVTALMVVPPLFEYLLITRGSSLLLLPFASAEKCLQ